jgi:hypothetical protein
MAKIAASTFVQKARADEESGPLPEIKKQKFSLAAPPSKKKLQTTYIPQRSVMFSNAKSAKSLF